MSVRRVGGVRVLRSPGSWVVVLATALACAYMDESASRRDATAARNGADVALARAEPEAALLGYRTALALEPQDAAARLGEARALAALGEAIAALAAYEPPPLADRVTPEILQVVFPGAERLGPEEGLLFRLGARAPGQFRAPLISVSAGCPND